MAKTARSNHANALIGLHVDFDEISGKNMQLFMVTGTATAVVVSANVSEQADTSTENITSIRGNRIAKQIAVKALEDTISSYKSSLATPGYILEPTRMDKIIAAAAQHQTINLIQPIFELAFIALVKFNRSDAFGVWMQEIAQFLLDLSSDSVYACFLNAFLNVRQTAGKELDQVFLVLMAQKTSPQ